MWRNKELLTKDGTIVLLSHEICVHGLGETYKKTTPSYRNDIFFYRGLQTVPSFPYCVDFITFFFIYIICYQPLILDSSSKSNSIFCYWAITWVQNVCMSSHLSHIEPIHRTSSTEISNNAYFRLRHQKRTDLTLHYSLFFFFANGTYICFGFSATNLSAFEKYEFSVFV